MPKTLDSFKTRYLFKKVDNANTVLFIHGVGLTQEMWRPQVEFFRNYTTLTYDLIGHGKTPAWKKPTFSNFSKQLLSLINQLELKKIHLVGFSLGALIARDFASKFSNRLFSLIILGSIYKRTENQKRIVINRWNVAKLNRSGSKKQALSRWLTEDFIKKNPKIYKEIYSILEKNVLKDFLKTYELFVHYEDDDDIIKKISVNTLVATGENDIGSTPEMGKNLSKIIKGSKFVEIQKGKHLCSIECADNVNIIFEKFINENNA